MLRFPDFWNPRGKQNFLLNLDEVFALADRRRRRLGDAFHFPAATGERSPLPCRGVIDYQSHNPTVSNLIP